MPFKLTVVASDSEFDELVRCEFDAYENPQCNLKNLFFPTHGPSPTARNRAIQDAVKRQKHWHRSDPSSQWIKVIDMESGKIAGAACWHIYETNPYTVTSDEECYWWPTGEARNIANALMGQFLFPRMAYMNKPHVFLDICFTHPAYRRRGVGNMLMEWGVQKAEEKSLESYIDATAIGRELYSKWGFVEGRQCEFTLANFPENPEA
ncbi:uncharacterized protein N7469_001882 [Penicillium citrinum]|uniref:N-acetyltransferase domain-containing protein n=1 Tax=Penicillium citrinum TaxID=5077 RepID=A0A9W9PFL0_PENCI|nr:uncharacterized protein N7469_001882 [Penicillium citrinum]KAJ5243555.1 hypothetical protein N7469_001882 [Penicillium citrinum]